MKFLFLLFFSSLAYAAPVTKWLESDTQVEFTILHKEDDRFFVDRFQKQTGELQERVSEKYFENEKSAKKYFSAVTHGFRDQAPASPRLQTFKVMGESLWLAYNQWDLSWEHLYSQWLKSLSPSFLKDNGIATDCADAAYAYRWIFSRINNLPTANHLAGTNQIFSNESMRPEWLSLPSNFEWNKDGRFLAALNYLLDNTYTHTLFDDLYSVAITPEFVAPGTVLINLSDESGHTEVFSDILTDPEAGYPLRVVSSDVPRKLRTLWEHGLNAYAGQLRRGMRELKRPRWPVRGVNGIELVEPNLMPGFSSTEQFELGAGAFYKPVGQRILPNWHPSLTNMVKSLLGGMMEGFLKRKSIVEEGFAYCYGTRDCLYGSPGYENWSTPSRDARLFQQNEELRVLVIGQCSYPEYYCCTYDQDCMNEYQSQMDQTITVIDSYPYTLRHALEIFNRTGRGARPSYDPNDPIATRWGW